MKKHSILTAICALFGAVSISVCGLLTLTGCSDGAYSSHSDGTSEHVHQLSYVSENQATCKTEGNIAYWACDCGSFFLDEEGTDIPLVRLALGKTKLNGTPTKSIR